MSPKLRMLKLKSVFFGLPTLWLALAQASTANAIETAEEMRLYISANLASHLPITVLGPLVAPKVEVEKTEQGYSVSIPTPEFTNGEVLGSIRFDMRERSRDTFVIENSTMSDQIRNLEGEVFPIRDHGLSGVWSVKDNTYRQLDYGFKGATFVQDKTETTLTKFSLSLEPKRANESQSFSIELGPLSLNQTNKPTKLIFDGLKANGSVVTPNDIQPYRVVGDLLAKLTQDGERLLKDRNELMRTLSPLYAPYDGTNLRLSTGQLRYDNEDEMSSFGFDSLTFNSAAQSMLQGQSGQSDFDFIVKDLKVNNQRNSLSLSKLRLFAGSEGVNGDHGFTFGQRFIALLEDNDAEIDLGDAFDLYLNFNNFGMQTELADFALSLGDGTSVDLGRASMGGELLEIRSDTADMVLNFSHEDISISGLSGVLIDALVPEESRFIVRLDDVPMAKVRDGLVGNKVPVSLITGDDKALSEFLRNLGFQLLSLILSQPPQIQIEDSFLNTPSIKTKIDGSFDIRPETKRLVTGDLNVFATGLKDLQKAASGAMRTAKGRTRQLALGLVGGLSLAQGIGKKQEDGSLLYKLNLDGAGQVKVNNLPLPKF